MPNQYTWLYKGKSFTEPNGYYGFVYRITNLDKGWMYLGKKFFTSAGYKQKKGKRKKIRKVSDWETYYGSNDLLNKHVRELGKSKFKREILWLCKYRAECAYVEDLYIFAEEALLKPNYYNYWVSTKIRKTHCNPFSESVKGLVIKIIKEVNGTL